jgi:cytochrome c-type biogenesis protein CcmH
MTGFIVLAALLALGTLALIAVPLLRSGGGSLPARGSALAAAGVLLVGSALLYAHWSTWSWRGAPPADSPETMVARLARELEQNPQNLDGWMMLGRSYTVLQEYPLAVRAFERADRISGGRSAEALIGEAQALALMDENELAGHAGQLIERALVLEPNSGKALFFGAALAQRRGDLPLARARLAKLLTLNPPDTVRPILEQQLSAIDQRIAAGPQAAATPQPSAPGASGESAVVRVNVSLAPALAANAQGAPLFVFVRNPGQGGPPLAVKRLESHFPQSVALTAADSMIPGRAFSAGQSVEVVARIARSGSPVGASGDPFGQITYHVGEDHAVSLVIDRVTP